MQKKYFSKTFRMKPSTFKRIRLARQQLKYGGWSSSWDDFFNKLMDETGIEEIEKTD
jgi:hypothetical protein